MTGKHFRLPIPINLRLYCETVEMRHNSENTPFLIQSLFVVCACGFFSGILGFISPDIWADGVAAILSRDPQRIERPIGELKDVLLDTRGRIYTLDSAYRRIQHYETDGQFVGSWKLPLNFKVIRANWKLDAQDQLHYLIGNQHFKLNLQTGFHPDPTPFEQLPPAPTLPKEIQILRPVFIPKIIKITPQGEKTLVQSKIHVFGIISGPLPAWLFSLICGIVATILSRGRRESPMTVSIFGITLLRK